jgi:hypothetical protein
VVFWRHTNNEFFYLEIMLCSTCCLSNDIGHRWGIDRSFVFLNDQYWFLRWNMDRIRLRISQTMFWLKLFHSLELVDIEPLPQTGTNVYMATAADENICHWPTSGHYWLMYGCKFFGHSACLLMMKLRIMHTGGFDWGCWPSGLIVSVNMNGEELSTRHPLLIDLMMV